jgi:hypothetical protein
MIETNNNKREKEVTFSVAGRGAVFPFENSSTSNSSSHDDRAPYLSKHGRLLQTFVSDSPLLAASLVTTRMVRRTCSAPCCMLRKEIKDTSF